MYFPTNNLSQQIVNTIAAKRGISGPELKNEVNITNPGLTKQAIYTNLRQLTKAEIVIKDKKHYSLNHLWLKKLENFTALSLGQIKKSLPSTHLEEGDKVTYKFKTGYHSDIYWAHIFNSLSSQQPANIPVIIYDPHEWFLLARKESEEFVYKEFAKNKKYLLCAIGGNTKLDKAVKDKWTNTYIQIHTGKSYGFKNTSYINVFHDTIIEGRLTDQLAKEIENFYNKNEKITPRNLMELEQIVKQNYQVKLIISKNKKKAEALRKKISRDFYIPK